MESQYRGRRIVKCVAEWRKKRPTEEGLDIGEVGLALLLEVGETDLYYRVRTNEFDCWFDTYLFGADVDSGWALVVTVLEKQ